MSATDLTTRLRSAIQPTHDRIEQLPLTKALADGRTGKSTYANLLSQLLAIHEPLENELASRPHLAAVYRPEMARTALLRGDLNAFGGNLMPGLPPTQQWLTHFSHWAEGEGWSLVGPLYVLEGSRMGSMILARRLAECFGVDVQPGQGLDYHIDQMAERPRLFQQFKARLNGLPLTSADADGVVAAAATTMDLMHEIYAAILPPEPALTGCTG
jgi:heme oxygenase